MAKIGKKFKISRLSVILGVVALVLILGLGAYFAYKNGIFASPSSTNQCTIKLASLNRTPNSFTVYVLDQQNYNKIRQNPSATGISTLARFSKVGDSYTLTGPDPVYFVGHKQNGELIFSTPFVCNQSQNIAVNADLSGGSITWTSASTSQRQEGNGTSASTSASSTGSISTSTTGGKTKIHVAFNNASSDPAIDNLYINVTGAKFSCSEVDIYVDGKDMGSNADNIKQYVHTGAVAQDIANASGKSYYATATDFKAAITKCKTALNSNQNDPCKHALTQSIIAFSSKSSCDRSYSQDYSPSLIIPAKYQAATSSTETNKNDSTNTTQTTTQTTAQTSSTECVKWKGMEVQLIKKGDLWVPVDSKNAPSGLERGLSDTELKLAQSSSEGKCTTTTSQTSSTDTNEKVAPINPNLRVPTIGINTDRGFPIGRGSITLQAARPSQAGPLQYRGQSIAPIGGVSFTINITTTYTPQTQTGKSSFPNNIPIAYAQTNSTSSTAGNANSTSNTSGNSNSTFSTAGNTNSTSSTNENTNSTLNTTGKTNSKSNTTENTNSTLNTTGKTNSKSNKSGLGFTYKSNAVQRTKDIAIDFFRRLFGKTYRVSTSGTIPDNGINSQIVITNLPPGDYSITLSKNGYETATVNFQLQDGEQKLISPVMMVPKIGAEPPSINSNATMMEANKEGVFWANTTSGKYLYNSRFPWWGWQFPASYNTKEPYYDEDGMPYPTNPYYSPTWGEDYWAYMRNCQNISLTVGPGINPNKAGLAAMIFGLMKPHTGKTFLEDSLLPGLGTYFAAGAIQNSGVSISVSQINQNCFSPQQIQYASNQGTLPSLMSLLHLPF